MSVSGAAQQWEYLVLRDEHATVFEEVQPMLNKAGQDGWELVHVENLPTAQDRWTLYYFKRPRRS